jgi:hypothetical protein
VYLAAPRCGRCLSGALTSSPGFRRLVGHAGLVTGIWASAIARMWTRAGRQGQAPARQRASSPARRRGSIGRQLLGGVRYGMGLGAAALVGAGALATAGTLFFMGANDASVIAAIGPAAVSLPITAVFELVGASLAAGNSAGLLPDHAAPAFAERIDRAESRSAVLLLFARPPPAPASIEDPAV